MVYSASAVCILRPSDRNFPGRGLCQDPFRYRWRRRPPSTAATSRTRSGRSFFPICRPILVTVGNHSGIRAAGTSSPSHLVLIKDVGLQTVPLALTPVFQGTVCIRLSEADGGNAAHHGAGRGSVLCIQQTDHQGYGRRSGQRLIFLPMKRAVIYRGSRCRLSCGCSPVFCGIR